MNEIAELLAAIYNRHAVFSWRDPCASPFGRVSLMSSRLLLVESNESELREMSDALSGAGGYSLTIARTFEEAVRALAQDSPDLLVTSLRLGAFHGLHVVLRSRFLDAFVPAIIVGLPGDYSDDVDKLGVPFVPKPIQREALLKAVAEQLRARQPRAFSAQRRWPRKHAHLPARIANSSVEVIDLSYGGLRLEANTPQTHVGAPIVVTFPTLGVSVTAVPRWTKAVGEGATSWCGVEILDVGMGPATTWRGVVDYEALAAAAPLVVDTRNAIKHRYPHVFRLGAPDDTRRSLEEVCAASTDHGAAFARAARDEAGGYR